uniref:Uncharacterized protein n=1 Tax=Pipistrellus kuhlii TaxID=59472 RepID=A0A7J7YX74_PIPKU|nr:hypothetical protein mPipKuh1_009838 [Pipistrellus kuhlii]
MCLFGHLSVALGAPECHPAPTRVSSTVKRGVWAGSVARPASPSENDAVTVRPRGRRTVAFRAESGSRSQGLEVTVPPLPEGGNGGRTCSTAQARPCVFSTVLFQIENLILEEQEQKENINRSKIK